MRPTQSLALGLAIAIFLPTLSLPPSRALGIGRSSIVVPGDRPSAATLHKTYGNLPMSFEKNAGQSRPGVDFIARGSATGLDVEGQTMGGAVLLGGLHIAGRMEETNFQFPILKAHPNTGRPRESERSIVEF